VAGSISYYDESGERLHTGYMANSPEYGKETFYKSFRWEIEEVRKRFQGKRFAGIADGTADNRKFLEATVDTQVLDFSCRRISFQSIRAAFKRRPDRNEWFTEACHRLRDEEGGAEKLLKEMQGILKREITDEKKRNYYNVSPVLQIIFIK
jgi:hypothetical protein